MYQERTYRKIMGKNLDHFLVSENESDLWIGFPKGLADNELITDLKYHLVTYRSMLKQYIETYPLFQSTLKPYAADPDAPDFISQMIKAGQLAEVGPMAAVAGAFCNVLGDYLRERNIHTYIIENGGDLLVSGFPEVTIGVHAGDESVFSKNLAIKIMTDNKLYGICSSSGMFGHSFSFGQADLVTVISENIFVADAFATSLANQVREASDINHLISMAKQNTLISGVLMIKDQTMGAFGNFELVEI